MIFSHNLLAAVERCVTPVSERSQEHKSTLWHYMVVNDFDQRAAACSCHHVSEPAAGIGFPDSLLFIPRRRSYHAVQHPVSLQCRFVAKVKESILGTFQVGINLLIRILAAERLYTGISGNDVYTVVYGFQMTFPYLLAFPYFVPHRLYLRLKFPQIAVDVELRLILVLVIFEVWSLELIVRIRRYRQGLVRPSRRNQVSYQRHVSRRAFWRQVVEVHYHSAKQDLRN